MKSISKKILNATLFWLILIIVLMTIVSVFVVSKITRTDSEIILTQVCEKETLRFNTEFNLLENSVTIIGEYISELEEENTSTKDMLTDEINKKIQDMTLSIANRTEGAMAVYFRYNPELTGNGTQGFFWSRKNDYEKFTYVEPTDILQFAENDKEHVGWFYEPKQRHAAMWMSPYYNKNLDVFMISYIVPYYTKSGDFLGVIGMDIDFDKVIELTKQVNLYKTGKVNLIDSSTFIFYSAAEDGKVQQKTVPLDFSNQITEESQDEKIFTIKDENKKTLLACTNTLQNDMKLLLYVPENEVYKQRRQMLFMFSLIMIFCLTWTIFIIVRITNRIIQPLQKLTRVTEKYAIGDWNDTFMCKTGDEIQELSETIYVMAGITKTYIAKIKANSITDELTGLKNKNCYLSQIEKFKKPGFPQNNKYGIIVFDINYLKKTNDTYGHEAGDKLIKHAGKFICKIFSHSPVYRIGGDEFNVILEQHDFIHKEELCKEFDEEIKNLPPVAGDIPLSLAHGIASYPEDGSTFDEVFNKADERMYENKKAMKAGRV